MAETAYRLPLENRPQRFDIAIGGIEYTMRCRWNESIGWVLDIDDAVTSTNLIACLPLVTGCNLLEQFDYLGFAFEMIVYTDGNPEAVPTLDNLGYESNVFLLVQS